MTWLQSRDLISKQKIHVYDHVEPGWVLCYQQIPKWYHNEQRLFCETFIHFIWISDLSSKKFTASEITYGSSRQLLSSHKSGFKRFARRIWDAPHATPTHSIHLIWSPVTSTCSRQWKKPNGFGGLTRNSFWTPARAVEGYWSKRIEWPVSSLAVACSRGEHGNKDSVRW
jgi:hypothetical protein